MSRMNWSERLSLGIGSIDRQHQVLIKCINELDEAIHKDENFKVRTTLNVIEKLVNYTKVHFMYEELVLFKQIPFPETEEHKIAHRKIFDAVEVFKDRLKTESITDIHPELVVFLNQWLTNHILKDDMKYAIYAKEQGINVQ